MTVVGGTYTELCFEPSWRHIFGSGLRAIQLLLDNHPSQPIVFYTCADKECKDHLDYYSGIYPLLKVVAAERQKSPEFYYDHPLRTPIISPRPDVLFEKKLIIEAEDDKLLAFGMIEADIKVNGNDVVYDPQSPVNPRSFRASGSSAKRLIVIVNQGEAEQLSGSKDRNEIKNFFFDNEHCFALIIKMGVQGAVLFESKESAPIRIPVYLTRKVWPIGSGDVFSSYFALCWFQGKNVQESAYLASRATSIYCNSRDLTIDIDDKEIPQPKIIEVSPVKAVYIAGPFFTFTQRWLVNEVFSIFLGLKLKVFSPYHDVGLGTAEDVVAKDVAGLESCDVMFAIVDGLDPGTIFEIGYAVSKAKKVIAFAQNVSEESLKMLVGTGCSIEQDLTTAVYKTYWTCATN